MPGPGHAEAFWRSRLWRKYAAVMALLCVAVIGGFGSLELRATFIDAQAQAERLQAAQAGEAALALRSALRQIDQYVGAVDELPWQRSHWLGPDTRREEFVRLLRLVPAAESITQFDAAGRELLRVSRYDVDRAARVTDLSAPVSPAEQAAARPALPQQGRIATGHGQQPVFDLVRKGRQSNGGFTAVRLVLKALAIELRPALLLPGAEVYAVDADGIVALHADPLVVASRLQAAPLQPKAGGAAPPGQRSPAPAPVAAAAAPPAFAGSGRPGEAVLRATVPIPELGWTMVVERPRAAVMAPVWATVGRVAVFLALGIALSMVTALALAGRLTRPVRQLHRAVAQVAAGRLDTSIAIRTGDELEDLAAQFNRMAASLQANVAELEGRVAARTRDLERANQHKSDFLAHMSHELRTPLNAVIGFADVLRDGMAGPLNAQQSEFVGDIQASGLHLLALINDVLDLSRIEAGQLALDCAEFAVADTVAQAAAFVRQRCLHKRLALTIAVDPAVTTWIADERRFKQVLVNLLGNAAKFTPPGGRIRLGAGLCGGSAGTGRLWVEVQDSGIGIAPSDHAAVFEQFRQVGADFEGRAEGSGLGLALVRSLVQQHGGTVTLHSALGEGALFRVELPAGLSPAEVASTPAPAPVAPPPTPPAPLAHAPLPDTVVREPQ